MNLLARWKSMKKETKIEIFFWLVVIFVFSPRILLEVYEHKLKNALIPFENNEWTVKDKDGNVIYENLTLPYDLRWKEQKTSRREWIFEKEIKTDHLKNVDDLAVVLGRVGDSDYVEFNYCTIGSTGLNIKEKTQDRWSWSLLRGYKVDGTCVGDRTSTIKYHIYKWGGPGYGVIGGPFGFIRFSEFDYYKEIIDTLRYGIQFSFGIGLIFFIGFQYLFLRLVAQNRESYGTFGFLSISVGMFLIMTSVYPFSMFNTSVLLEVILFASAIGAAVFFLKFFQQKFSLSHQKLLKIFVFVSLILLTLCGFQKTFDKAYKIYEIWHPLFLLMFIIFFFGVFRSLKNKPTVYSVKYFIAYAVFVICSIHDVVITLLGISNAYLIGTAFPFFVLVVALYLSREYSDAFSKVEEQVVQRTHELNLALRDVQNIQKLKDDQAKRFAHDIRSPLAALKVLKDIIAPAVPEDQGGLLKHAIVRINDLANTVLPKLIDEKKILKDETKPVFLWPIIDKIISEKKIEFKHIGDFTIDLNSQSNIFEISVMCNETDMARVVSNLINNAIQARQENNYLQIQLQIEEMQDKISLILKDNGKGINQEIISKVFDSGFTFGKKDGMGIGLSSAKELIESWNGKISLESQVGVGTTITIQLPKATHPDWLLTKLNLKDMEQLVVIDDQPFVTETWKQKLQGIALSEKIVWIQNVKDWIQWFGSNKIEKTMFLVDYDLGASLQGLDIISKYALLPNAALITGHDDDREVRAHAVAIGAKILPKSLIHMVPVEL